MKPDVFKVPAAPAGSSFAEAFFATRVPALTGTASNMVLTRLRFGQATLMLYKRKKLTAQGIQPAFHDKITRTMTNTVSEYSSSGLLMMYGGIRNALAVDDNLPTDVEKPYGVRCHDDWRRWANSIEAELDNRDVKYEKIVW